jgi:hypothetical protein
MKIVSIILWAIAIWLPIAFSWNVRRLVWQGGGYMPQTANFCLLLVVQVLAMSGLNLSTLHFLWMTPAAFVISQMTILFPFSLLSPFGRIYASLCCLGLNGQEVAMNRSRLEYARELVASGCSKQDAVMMARERFPVE